LKIHDLDPEEPPADLTKFNNYPTQGGPDREKYYFRRVILGLDRAIDYLAARPDFDGKHLVINGLSQGGGLSLILAGLNQHITAAETDRPAMCDYLGPAGDWPGLKRGPQWAAMSAYFDAVNFARKIKCPTLFQVGFVDTTCPPTSVYAAYNTVSAPKHIFNYPLFGHGGGAPPAAAEFEKKWMLGQLGLGPAVPFPGKGP
jgi:cephalosporin-C deacetylase